MGWCTTLPKHVITSMIDSLSQGSIFVTKRLMYASIINFLPVETNINGKMIAI